MIENAILVFIVGAFIGVSIGLPAFGLFVAALSIGKHMRENEKRALYESEHAGEVISPRQIQKVDEFAAMGQKTQPLPEEGRTRVFADSYFISDKPRFIDTYYGHFGDSYYADGGLTTRDKGSDSK